MQSPLDTQRFKRSQETARVPTTRSPSWGSSGGERPRPVKGGEAFELPPCSVVLLTGFGNGLYTAEYTEEDNPSPCECYVTGPAPIQSNGQGYASQSWPLWARTDAENPPEARGICGVADQTGAVRAGYKGFCCLALNGDSTLALIQPIGPRPRWQ